MKIVLRDGRELAGEPLEIVRAMQKLAFGVEQLSIAQYAEWVAANARRVESVEMLVEGQTDVELAGALVEEMLRTGLAAKR